MPTLAHLSDLHFGKDPALEESAERLCSSLLAHEVDQVVLTGDITQNGLASEYARFERTFAPLLAEGRVFAVPGNHDRRGDDLRSSIMPADRRIQIETDDHLHLVRLDSTGTHNRSRLSPQGRRLKAAEITEIVDALKSAPRGRLTVLALHHHPLPLPGDDLVERISSRLGLRMPRELCTGLSLLSRINGHCDLVLFGHRHVPRALLPYHGTERPLGLYNAGCSTGLGRVRVFAHEAGRVRSSPHWLYGEATGAPPSRRPRATATLR